MTTPDRARLLKTVHDHITEFSKWTDDSVLAFRAPSATHEYKPTSLSTGRLSNQKLKETLHWMRTKVPEFTFTILHDQTIVDVEQRKVMLYLKSYAPTEIGIYQNEYIWLIKLTDDGREIADSFEFMDSKYADSFFDKFRVPERPDPSLKDIKG